MLPAIPTSNVVGIPAPQRRSGARQTTSGSAKYRVLSDGLRLLRGEIATRSARGPAGAYYTRARVLDEVLRAAGVSGEGREDARAAYDLLTLLASPSVEGTAREGNPLLTRRDLLALRLYLEAAGGGDRNRSRRRTDAPDEVRARALEAVLRLADAKAPLNLHGSPIWVQAVAVAAADADLLSPDQKEAVLQEGAVVSGALLFSHAWAKGLLILPPRRDVAG